MTDAEHQKNTKKIYDYLKKKVKEEGAKKILDKAAKKLGVAGYVNLVQGKFPAAALAKFSVGYLKLITFESYFSLYANNHWTKYDPAKESDTYVEYLLYSWARGEPGYIYQFDVLPRRL